MTSSTAPQYEPGIACALMGRSGQCATLTDVAVRATLRDLLAEVTVEQTYRNAEAVNIEAVYTFPLPLDAILLRLDVEIGARRLEGTVVERRTAERQYEDAVSEGDSAVMLEVAEQGLYTMNVGNLLPNETAKIRYSYALLHRWSGDALRLHLPTTIAPRYGHDPMRPHQVPEASLIVENRFSLQMEIYGKLREARWSCPTHVVSMASSPDKTVISLSQERAAMDRDFVLNVVAPRGHRSFAVCGADGEGQAAVASFQPFFAGNRTARALDLAIVVDCSGSMAGVSMQQARKALTGILQKLQPEDRLSFIAFGTSTRTLWHRAMKCTDSNLERAHEFAAQLDANLGGTELQKALNEAYSMLGPDTPGDILLITDGQVGGWSTMVARAKSTGHRIFAVGVGSAVSEALVRNLAEATGGQSELVSPNEGMAERVVRHFERMRAPRATRVSVRWPENAIDTTPAEFGAVFEGDSILATARFDSLPADAQVVLDIEFEAGDRSRQVLPLGPANADAHAEELSTVARVAASMRMSAQSAEVGRATALHYRLVSEWTNWLVIAPRMAAEKAQNLPQLRKVRHTLAAGWGATGAIALHCVEHSLPMRQRAERIQRFDIGSVALMDFMTWTPPPWHEVRAQWVRLANAEPSRLAPHRAMALLAQPNVIHRFASLFGLTGWTDSELDGIAAILIVHCLNDVAATALSDEARAAFAQLQQFAVRSEGAIAEPRHREALLEALDQLTKELTQPAAATIGT